MNTLEVYLLDERIGTIMRLPDDRNLFFFEESYIDNKERSTLSLSFKDSFSNLISDFSTTRTRLLRFFSNLLPEGSLRDFLATHVDVNPKREFFLLKALGEDLPGAVRVAPSPDFIVKEEILEQVKTFHFSLAGVQLKFSALLDKGERLTIPTSGVGGAWIVKLPSYSFEGVPENEFSMMELARKVGISVPKTALVPVENIRGLPSDIRLKGNSFVIERFDREEGKRIHVEDFAQVFGVYPEKKYERASYRSLAEVIWLETGEKGLTEFVRRLVFSALIGNGDMHLKNWSLIYRDGKAASLSPAYDFVSTIPYIPNEGLALTFCGSRDFSSLNLNNLKRFSAKAKLPESIVARAALETVQRFHEAFKDADEMPESLKAQISKHSQTIRI